MKILWLSFTAAGAGKVLNNSVAGCGWISSLEDGIRQVPGIDLAVGFFHDKDAAPFEHEGVKYYPIQKKYTGFAGKITQRLFNSLYDVNPAGIKAVINDFAPDVIHLFGTESGMVDVLRLTSVPVITHLQGLVSPYLSAWFPKGMSQHSILVKSSLRSILLRRGYYFEYGLFKKRAKREESAIVEGKYFFGRTAWDRNYLELIKKDFTYFHCEEVLRSFFYDYQWKQPNNNVLKLVTVINAQLYKGLEMILETASLLKQYLPVNFEWHVIGMTSTAEMVPIIEKGMKLKFVDNHVLFKGAKIDKALIEELLGADIFIHPSHIDNSPNSVCEAMLLGMPVFAGNTGGLSTLITQGEDGQLYNSYDSFELAGMIKKAIRHQPYLAKMGENARKKALKRHDINTIVDTVIGAYQDIATRNNKTGALTVAQEQDAYPA